MKAPFVSVLLATILFSGCVSISDYRKLQSEFNDFKAYSIEKQKYIENDISLFKEAYNPELHITLNKNLDESALYLSRLREIYTEMGNIEINARKLLDDSQIDRNIIAENAKSSVSQNVVNEFYTLRNKWDTTLSDLIKLSVNANDSANKAKDEAIKAGERSISAERAANKAAENSQIALGLNKNIVDLSNRIQQIDIFLKQIQSSYASMDSETKKNIDLLSNLYKSIIIKIEDIERIVQELSKAGQPKDSH